MPGAAENVFIVIAAYNEAKVIRGVIRELVGVFRHVVVVDDGSFDKTGDLALSAGAIVLRHAVNLGQGAALQTGIAYALVQGAPFIATFDADGQHDPRDLVAMYKQLSESADDVVLGSRFLGSAPGITQRRKLVLKAATLFQRLTTGMALSDAHNGLRLFRRGAAEQIRIEQNGMAHASEIVGRIAELKLRVIEAPCSIRYTAYSTQKGQRLSGGFQILLDLFMRRLHR